MRIRAKFVLAAAVAVLALSGCSSDAFRPLSIPDIQDIRIWYNHFWSDQSSEDTDQTNPNITLTKEEIAEFVSLYNQSQVGGKATGEGGTPQFGVRVTLQNGSEINVNQFDVNERFEVVHSKAAFYLKNAALYDWIRQQIEDEL